MHIKFFCANHPRGATAPTALLATPLLPTKFQLTNLTRLNRSPLSIPIVYVVSARQLVPSAISQSLIVALTVLKRLDYGNAAQAGLPS
jgi:hypothetical protein